MRKILVVVLAIMVMATSAYADIWDNVVNYIKGQETETGAYYNFDTKAVHGYVGRTLAQDVFIKRANLALTYDLKTAIGIEANYTIKEGTVAPYAGLIVGTNRIEKLKQDGLGEVFVAVSGGVKF